MELTSEVIAFVLAHAEAAAPAECCGLLLGRGVRIESAERAGNVASDPRRRFEIDPAALFAAHRAARAGGPQVLGYYHSHPEGHPLPSATDCEHANGDGRIWAIAAQGKVGFWRDGDRGFEPLFYRLVDG